MVGAPITEMKFSFMELKKERLQQRKFTDNIPETEHRSGMKEDLDLIFG